MSKIIALALVIMLVAGCTSSTSFGPCIGLTDKPNPHLIYHPSIWNIFLGIVFIETIIVPLFVVFDETACPVGLANG